MNIFPALPVPDNVFSTKQTKPRITTKTEFGYQVKRHRSNFAPRTFTLSYRNIKLTDRALLRNFLVQQDYGITAFLFKHPVEDLAIYAIENRNDLFELEADATGGVAQGFQLEIQSKVHRVQLYLKKTGSPSGNIFVTINTDDTDKPSASILATSDTVAVSTITTGWTLIEFEFATPARLEPFTQYHIVLSGDATYDASFVTGVTVVEYGQDSSSPTYGYGNSSTWAPTAWTAKPTLAGIFTIPDYTRVQTSESTWQEERISGALGGIFNLSLTLVEDA